MSADSDRYRGVFHFSFTVSDMDRSVKFYEEVLGLELIHQQVQDNEYTRKFVGYPDASLRVAQFKVPGQPAGLSTHDLELVEYVQPKGERGEPNICNPGEAHLCFVVTDIEREYERLRGLGVRFVSEPVRIEAGVNRGGATCYFFDPDDIVLEILQPATLPPA